LQQSCTIQYANSILATSVHFTNHRPHAEFTTRYRQQTGLEPPVAAREIYDAVRLLAAAVYITVANRVRVRDYPASGPPILDWVARFLLTRPAILKANTFYQAPPILPFGQRFSREPPPCAASANSPRSRRASPRDAQTRY
jgi:hypothetical protein